jgi:hypothetical protein
MQSVIYSSYHAVAQVVGHRLLTAKSRVRFRVSQCGICGGKRGTRTGFSEYFAFTSLLPFYQRSTIIYLSRTPQQISVAAGKEHKYLIA